MKAIPQTFDLALDQAARDPQRPVTRSERAWGKEIGADISPTFSKRVDLGLVRPCLWPQLAIRRQGTSFWNANNLVLLPFGHDSRSVCCADEAIVPEMRIVATMLRRTR